MPEIKIDPEFEALIPPLSPEEFAGLEAGILADGCLSPLVVWNDILVDGHNRFKICTQHGIDFQTRPVLLADRRAARLWIYRNQMHRRNITVQAKIRLGLAMKADIEAEAKERQGTRNDIRQISDECLRTDEVIADGAGTSRDTVRKYEKVLNEGTEDLIAACDDGRISISAAAEIATLPAEEQDAIAKAEDAPVAKIAKAIKADKHRKSKAARLEVIKAMPWPEGKYRVILADPPWSYDNSGLDASAAKQYETMSTEDICTMPIRDLATDNAVLFMWGTSPLLPDALRVIESWGFEYKTSIVWDKDRPNYGNYVSVQHEFLFIATRGACTPDIDLRPGSVLRIERTGRHSEKPEEFRKLIDTLYPNGPRIELFARTAVEGWERWGNEAA
jgi:N6-adenosine-specific RNA methylase IME4